MGWRTNVALAVVVGGLGSYLYFNQEEKPDPAPNGNLGSEKLLPQGAWSARQVCFQYAENREPVILDLDRVNQKYMVVDPVRDVASFAVLESILNVYETANLVPGYSAEELAADPSLIEKTGLDEPLGKIEFRYPPRGELPAETVTVEFGHPGVRDGEMWVRVGDAIHRADPALRSLLDKNPDDFRERLLFTDFGIGQFRKIRFNRLVAGEIQTHVVERTALDSIQIREPLVARADPAAFSQYLRSIGSLYIDRFLTGGSQEHAPDQPMDYQISVAGDRGSETLDVRILPDGTFFGHLHRRDINFVLKKRGLVDLDRWLPGLRQKLVVTIPEKYIERLELEPAKKTGVRTAKAVFVRTNEGFRIAEPIEIPKTNPTPLGELLHALTHLTARQFVDDPKVDAGLDDGDDYLTVRVGVRPGVGLQSIAVRIGKVADKGLVFAKREDEAHVFRLAAADVQPLRRPWLDFASLYVPPLTTSAFRVEVRAPGRKEPIVYKNEEYEWRGAGATGDDAEVRELVDALKTLRSQGIVPVSELDTATEPVRVLLRRNTHAQSGEIYEMSLRPFGAHVVLQVKGQDAVAYRVEQPPFRSLLDRWTKR